MNELILGVLLLAHIIYHAWYVKEVQKERDKTLRALMSKNLQEYHASEIMESRTEVVEPPLPDEIPIEDLEDEGFQKMISRQLHGQ